MCLSFQGMGMPWVTNREGWRSKVKSDLEPRGRLLAIALGLAPVWAHSRIWAEEGGTGRLLGSGEVGEKTMLSFGFRLVGWRENTRGGKERTNFVETGQARG